MNITPKQEALFWAKVDKTGDCWIWTRSTAKGYGQICINKRVYKTHRVAYELLVGPIPDGKVIDHTCYEPLCVNPDHLRPVTVAQNAENRSHGANSNSKSGIRGVHWDRRKHLWRVSVARHQGGYFHDIEDANRAAVALRNELMTHNDADRVA